MQIEWWYWIIAGFGLIVLELFIPSFTIIWLGMGALAVGLMKSVWPGFPLIGQIIMWIVCSVLFTIMWFKYLKPKKDGSESSATERPVRR